MRNDLAIQVQGLGKRYRIGAQQEPYGTLRDTLAGWAAAPFRALRSHEPNAVEGRAAREFWALKDVSFEVKQGEAVGVIGRNGAGKSTLLKTLSRITEPTTGYADITGRVGSLLEVGTGFHPELTGRENILLNGAILGMRRAEIMRKFDEIVAFSEVEKFIETPVKYYSSGMYLRLAFSVAAHLEPEILLVDEVLAVGDMAFQQKCMGKMDDVAAEGRTVLFVSHNLGAIKELCRTCLVLKDGGVGFHGSAVDGVAFYSRDVQAQEPGVRNSNRGTHWTQVRVGGVDAALTPAVGGGEPFVVEARLDVQEPFIEGRFKCRLDDAAGNTLVHHVTDHKGLELTELNTGKYCVRIEFPPLWLTPGIYTLYFKLTGSRHTGEEKFYKSERVLLNITGRPSGQARAVLNPPLRWTLAPEAAHE